MRQIPTMLIAFVSIAPALAGCSQRECNAQNDCPVDQGCTADGKCVELPASARSVVGAGGAPIGAESNVGSDTDGTGAVGGDANADGAWGTVTGTMGPLTLHQVSATRSGDNETIQVNAPTGEQADALLFLFFDCASADATVLKTPGTYHFDSQSLTAAAWGQACTTNEHASVPHYDEQTSVDAVVDEKKNVTLHWVAPDTDVTGTFGPL